MTGLWRHTQTRPRLYVSDLSLSDALQRFVLGDPADALSRPDGSSGVCCWYGGSSVDEVGTTSLDARRERGLGGNSLNSTEGLTLVIDFDELKDMLIDGDLGMRSLKEKVEDLLAPGGLLPSPVDDLLEAPGLLPGGVGERSGCARAHACSRVSERA